MNVILSAAKDLRYVARQARFFATLSGTGRRLIITSALSIDTRGKGNYFRGVDWFCAWLALRFLETAPIHTSPILAATLAPAGDP